MSAGGLRREQPQEINNGKEAVDVSLGHTLMHRP